MNTSEFENHLVFEKLEQLNNRISEEEVRNKIELDRLNFYDSFCKYISDRLKLTIPVLVQVGELNALANEIEAGFTQINNFIGNNNIGHLNNADANFNSAMTRLRNFPLPFSKNDFNFSKSISNFESIVKSKFVDVENENKNLKEELKKVQENLTAKQNEINSLSQLLTSNIQPTNATFVSSSNIFFGDL